MKKEEIFKELHIDDSHNVWDDRIDTWNSIEALRFQTGELPNGQYDEVQETINFLRNKVLQAKLFEEDQNALGSAYLSAKRFLRKHLKE